MLVELPAVEEEARVRGLEELEGGIVGEAERFGLEVVPDLAAVFLVDVEAVDDDADPPLIVALSADDARVGGGQPGSPKPPTIKVTAWAPHSASVNSSSVVMNGSSKITWPAYPLELVP